MKLYTVSFSSPISYSEVREEARKVDPNCMITVVESNVEYEFQSEKAANHVANVLDGKIRIIEYNANDLFK